MTRQRRSKCDDDGDHKPTRQSAAGKPRKNVLITGGAGFIGTNVALRCAREGYAVRLFDNFSRAGVEQNARWLCQRFPDQIELSVGDVRDSRALQAAVQRADWVFHFAAQVAVTTSLVHPEEDFEINAGGTLNVLEACRRCATPPRLLFTSTNKVYGDLPHVTVSRHGSRYAPCDPTVKQYGIDESCPLAFHSPYGCSKGTADQYVLDYARCYGLQATVFRMSCIYGPHQCGTEDQGWVAHFVRAIRAESPLTVYGDGSQVRDLLYVEDLVEAMFRAVTQIERTRTRAFNMGGGPTNAASVGEVIRHIEQLHGSPAVVSRGPWRQGDQRYYVSDTRAFQRLTGWRPEVDVATGIERLYAWLASPASASRQAIPA